ncbi:MAG: diacylglycerol kinase family lipid kinase [Planctomycetota bacterium]|jgi:diacylglycerol kinase (ATP)|nr:hypothetical protein [Planctomycetota bacterium]MDP6369469.1 diacylglycerol kinase family lipid kinase [Planctomycetota bacterium]MDP6957086.1 diacylglycerol kinase family lipid kinase [Planctomycetota bacterium]
MQLLIINPIAGGRRARQVAGRAKDRIEAAGGTVRELLTERAGHGREHVATADLAGVTSVVAVGGDGTVLEVVEGLMERAPEERPALGLLPAGSGNSLAVELDMADEARATARLLAGETRSLDLLHLTVDGQAMHSMNVLGWGAVAEINRRSEPMRFLGGTRYTLAALREICRWRLSYPAVAIDGVAGEWLMGTACITRFVGSGMMMAPSAKLDDGLVDLVLVRAAGRFKLLGMLLAVFKGKHVNSPLVDYRQVAGFSLELDAGSYLVLDGEILPARSVEARVLPGALRLLA